MRGRARGCQPARSVCVCNTGLMMQNHRKISASASAVLMVAGKIELGAFHGPLAAKRPWETAENWPLAIGPSSSECAEEAWAN